MDSGPPRSVINGPDLKATSLIGYKTPIFLRSNENSIISPRSLKSNDGKGSSDDLKSFVGCSGLFESTSITTTGTIQSLSLNGPSEPSNELIQSEGDRQESNDGPLIIPYDEFLPLYRALLTGGQAPSWLFLYDQVSKSYRLRPGIELEHVSCDSLRRILRESFELAAMTQQVMMESVKKENPDDGSANPTEEAFQEAYRSAVLRLIQDALTQVNNAKSKSSIFHLLRRLKNHFMNIRVFHQLKHSDPSLSRSPVNRLHFLRQLCVHYRPLAPELSFPYLNGILHASLRPLLDSIRLWLLDGDLMEDSILFLEFSEHHDGRTPKVTLRIDDELPLQLIPKETCEAVLKQGIARRLWSKLCRCKSDKTRSLSSKTSNNTDPKQTTSLIDFKPVTDISLIRTREKFELDSDTPAEEAFHMEVQKLLTQGLAMEHACGQKLWQRVRPHLESLRNVLLCVDGSLMSLLSAAPEDSSSLFSLLIQPNCHLAEIQSAFDSAFAQYSQLKHACYFFKDYPNNSASKSTESTGGSCWQQCLGDPAERTSRKNHFHSAADLLNCFNPAVRLVDGTDAGLFKKLNLLKMTWFQMDYDSGWPASELITPDAVDSYGKVFRLFLGLNGYDWLLRDVDEWIREREWILTRMMHYRSLQVCRARFLLFLRLIMEYLFHQVTEVSWSHFLSKIQQLNQSDQQNQLTLSALIDAHRAYVSEFEGPCRLTSQLWTVLESMLQHITAFHELLTSKAKAGEGRSENLLHMDFDAAYDQSRDFVQKYKFFVQLLRSLIKRNYDPSLEALHFRLTFNHCDIT